MIPIMRSMNSTAMFRSALAVDVSDENPVSSFAAVFTLVANSTSFVRNVLMDVSPLFRSVAAQEDGNIVFVGGEIHFRHGGQERCDDLRARHCRVDLLLSRRIFNAGQRCGEQIESAAERG